MATHVKGRIGVGPLAQLKERGCAVVTGGGHAIAVFYHEGNVYAVDNRCPHMGFPLDRGSVKDGILTCHWHHARFDLSSGGTFNPFADDVRSFPVEVVDGEVWVDPEAAGPRRSQPLAGPAGGRIGAQSAAGYCQGGAGDAGFGRRLPGAAENRRPLRYDLLGQRLGRRHEHPDLHRQHAAAAA